MTKYVLGLIIGCLCGYFAIPMIVEAIKPDPPVYADGPWTWFKQRECWKESYKNHDWCKE